MLSSPPRHVVELTADGSPTVRDMQLGCTFHSRHGALAETMHVFIEAGLKHWITSHDMSVPSDSPIKGEEEVNRPEQLKIRILEVGFGSGLNVAATFASFPATPIHFTTLERFPLGDEAQKAVVECAPEPLRRPLADMLRCDWGSDQMISSSFTLKKMEADLLTIQVELPFDVCYFDAFAPAAQPELWTVEVFQRLLTWALPGAVLVTYCSKGDVRRAMLAAGWTVQKWPGPKGKREMLRAVRHGA
jgi:tRNA U34 5-methylaminomethyl-2-thiouridine-forming methyltransferase MnmC